jgi:protocatechuate 3,4-dioxygenase beta subunit
MAAPPNLHDHVDDHDRGLAFDLGTLVERRRALKLLGGAGLGLGLAGLAACSSDDTAASGTTSSADGSSSSASSSGTGTTATDTSAIATDGSCEAIPEETAGPYPGDGSNGPNVLAESGVVRSDITSSFGSASGVATGVPLEVVLTVQETANGCAALAGGAVYLWHCDAEGNYSLYSEATVDENYLRGVQETDGSGQVRFTTIFPGCYSGRWPHIHFEVYPSLDAATSADNQVATSQLAFPQDACEVVYALDGYSSSASNLSQISLSSDNVFGEDSAVLQMATVTGDADSGYVAQLRVPI